METKAFDDGNNAYFAGATKEENPYTEEMEEFDEWESGWLRADSDCDDN